MHEILQRALPDAEGSSDLVVVTFVDVRGFSSFAGMADSSEAALFLRRMYLEIVSNYFPGSAFFKPTGDGLMIVRHYDQSNLQKEVEYGIRQCLSLVDDVAAITAQDPMVNFDVPDLLGIGMARGAATRLASGDLTLDYSGRPLNLAARLMDLARPSGVVFNEQLVKGISLPQDLASQFAQETVYVRGLHDSKPLNVFSSQKVTIPARNRLPLEGATYETRPVTARFSEVKNRGPRFIHLADLEPVSPDDVELVVSYPAATKSGGKSSNLMHYFNSKPLSSQRTRAGWELIFDYDEITARASSHGVKSTWEVRTFLRYLTCDQIPSSEDIAEADADPA